MAAVRQLNAEVARKIAAGEVIDRPNAIVRELMDNAVDSGASRINVEITQGGIEKIRVIDNGCGMTKEDLSACARPHATSKITSETDLLKLTTLGFRGEALSSMAAVSRLEITSGGFKMNASVTEDHVITPVAKTEGTIVQTQGLFENFPARRMFLKRPASEALMCKSTFQEKVLPRPDLSFTFSVDGEEKLNLSGGQSLKERFVDAMELFETEDLFYQIDSKDSQNSWSFSLVIGEPSVSRTSRKEISIYVNGRKINEYSLVQAIEYGAEGYFPNGTHPVACLFAKVDSSQVDFNIHPAKKEARFKDLSSLHRGVSSAVRNFFKQYTVKNLVEDTLEETQEELSGFYETSLQKDFSSQVGSSEKATISSIHLSPKNYAYPDKNFRGDYRTSFFNGSFSNGNKSYTEKILQELQSNEKPGEQPETKHNYIQNALTDSDNFHFVGSALGTFLIAEKNDTLYIIDQHAADERRRFNEIMEKSGEKQNLIVPYSIQTSSASEDNYLEEIKDGLNESGFTIKNCGNGKWEVSTVPVRWKGSEGDLQRDLLQKRINPKDVLTATAASTACRSAVMDGTVLDDETAAQIAKSALELPDPHCPHGRPVYTKITTAQLFALVKRT